MSRDHGYPSSLIRQTRYGSCILKLSWAGPGDEWRFPDSPTTSTGDAPARADLNCPQFGVEGCSYSAYAEALVNEADLSFRDLSVHLTPLAGDRDRGPIPHQHEELWHAHAATVLTDLLTREYFELLRRADARRALRAARGKHADLTAALHRTEERGRYYEIRTAVLALEDADHRDVGLRLARNWNGTADELLTVIAATTRPQP